MQQNMQPPILLLHEMAQRGRQFSHSLPQQVEVRKTWEGVGFQVGELNVVAPLEQVKEILTSATISRIPGAKEWVKGVSNVRGNLLPILDLPGFLWGKTTKMTRHSRILVIQHQGISAGLVVDGVMGMRHFLEEEFSPDTSFFDEALQNVMSGIYRQSGERWAVFDIHKLVERPEFLQVAA
jgi:twitching motility protein PilI